MTVRRRRGARGLSRPFHGGRNAVNARLNGTKLSARLGGGQIAAAAIRIKISRSPPLFTEKNFGAPPPVYGQRPAARVCGECAAGICVQHPAPACGQRPAAGLWTAPCRRFMGSAPPPGFVGSAPPGFACSTLRRLMDIARRWFMGSAPPPVYGQRRTSPRPLLPSRKKAVQTRLTQI